MTNLNTKKTVLVTGGTGFLGAYVIRELLDKGYAVRAIRRGNTLSVFIPAHRHNKPNGSPAMSSTSRVWKKLWKGSTGSSIPPPWFRFPVVTEANYSALMWKGRLTSSMRRSRKTSAALYTSVP